VIFEVAHFRPSVDQASKNRGIYHNPKRQRGIPGKSFPNAESQSLADASGWDCSESSLKFRVLMREEDF
jgi:hypothetical protein